MPQERSSSRRPHVRFGGPPHRHHAAADNKRRRGSSSSSSSSSSGRRRRGSIKRRCGHKPCRNGKRGNVRSVRSLTVERDHAVGALRREEATSKRLRQQISDQNLLRVHVRDSVFEAMKIMEKKIADQIAKLKQGTDIKLTEMRAEVLREKLLRDSQERAATKARGAAAKLQEKTRCLGAYVRKVGAPCAAKEELLQDAEDAIAGVVAHANVPGAASSDSTRDAGTRTIGTASVPASAKATNESESDDYSSDYESSSSPEK
eukprot:12406152-Karenia_brevis.AAC.1